MPSDDFGATWIVEALDVSEQFSPRLVPGGLAAVMDPLGLEVVREAHHVRIVLAVALSAHERGDVGLGQDEARGLGGILDSPVGLMDQVGRWPWLSKAMSRASKEISVFRIWRMNQPTILRGCMLSMVER